MWFKNRTICFRLVCGFGIIIILTLILGLVALTRMRILTGLTIKMHDHPLAVSDAARDIRANIFAMHRTMKDIALSENDDQVNAAMEQVGLNKQAVLKLFDIISERFLGDQKDVQKAHKVFSDWKVIREEVYELMLQGKQDQAEAITKGKGNDHVDYILNTIQVMIDYADAKANEFFSNSQRIYDHQLFLLNALILIIVISSIVIAILISKSITAPVGKIIKEIKAVAKGDFSRKVSIDGTKEIGQLAAEFNNMAAELTASTTSMKSLNEEVARRELSERNTKASNQQLRASNQQLQASDQQLRALNQQLATSEQQLKASNQQLLATEQQLKASNQQLRANEREREVLVNTLKYKNKELQDVVYTASHDLKSPLVNLTGFSGCLVMSCEYLVKHLESIDDASSQEKIKDVIQNEIPESLGYITSSVEKMKSLIDGLLRISRIGTVDIDIADIDMDELLGQVRGAMEFQLQENITHFDVGDLPRCRGDIELVNQVFTNLIDNALKYREPTRETVIEVSGKVEVGKVVYCVKDNGRGVAENHQSKVFEIFHRLNPEEDVIGEGLGLTIVTRIVDRLGGRIWLESEAGVGCSFFVTLPNE